MKNGKYIKAVDRQLESLIPKGNTNIYETTLYKYFIAESIMAFILVFNLLVISFVLEADILVHYSLSLIIIGSLTTIAGSFLFKKVESKIIVQQAITLLIVTYFVARMGGLLNSGGIIFLGAAPVLKTMVFKNKWRMISIFLLFLFCVVGLFFLDDNMMANNTLNATQNKLFFTLNLTVITSYVFIFALYSQRLFTGLEQREAKRQKEINEAKTRLFTNITHEFRTPLTVILGLADSLKSEADETIRNNAETISKNGKSLLQLVTQMLDISKLESGNLKVNMIHGNIIPFLRYIFQLQEYYAQEKNLIFIFDAESQSYELDFDPDKITTIVSNLLHNAIKFSQPGVKIRLKVKIVGNYLCIEIIDNGTGISQENINKVFDRFYQVDDQSTRNVGGTGIGLALTKELVTLLKGTIAVTSNPGNETVFTVKLPVTDQAKRKFILKDYTEEEPIDRNHLNKTGSENPTPAIDNNKPRVLIIEDNSDLVNYLKSCYQYLFSIDVAPNGKEGYNMAINLIPDLIISDVMMPEMDGFQICEKLKNDYRTSHIPIILLTAKADLPSRIEGLDQGADAYIEKPFNQQELLVRIKKLLELRWTLIQRYKNGESLIEPGNQSTRREDKFMKKVNASVKKHLRDENYDVHSLCEEMAMSKSQLYRKFKALTNMSASKYIRKLRMQHARHLLLTTSMNITEVSYEVGMKTLSTFSDIFKDEFGQSPSQYQNQYNGKHKRN
ncbi:hybrid sensor histidine kinase/response regulator transcription factor [Marinilabilia rubra]|uniref:histidine kinase n=1 Tax=Marinilabilia rubra TaxID=2162893 RepID=A0A2U2BC62_9BACT|nr:ATP-binding protein [Marinilabilia rubra]PWE00650.1 hypothetical protein DDZ16_03375 [Marinilabilia rubra]